MKKTFNDLIFSMIRERTTANGEAPLWVNATPENYADSTVTVKFDSVADLREHTPHTILLSRLMEQSEFETIASTYMLSKLEQQSFETIE